MKHAEQSGATDYLAHSFAVWTFDCRFGVDSTVMVASFRYLLEAIDYCQYCAGNGVETVLRSTATAAGSISRYGPAKGAA